MSVSTAPENTTSSRCTPTRHSRTSSLDSIERGPNASDGIVPVREQPVAGEVRCALIDFQVQPLQVCQVFAPAAGREDAIAESHVGVDVTGKNGTRHHQVGADEADVPAA